MRSRRGLPPTCRDSSTDVSFRSTTRWPWSGGVLRPRHARKGAIFLARFFDPPIIALAVGVGIGGVAQIALLLLATAGVHDLTFVTRNERDCAGRGVPIFNPWAS